MDLKLELIAVPVTDIDRAKAFYEKVGFHADHDSSVSDEIRFVQLTPPGSACSICIGKGLTEARPGSLDMILLVVDDAQAAGQELRDRGIDATEIEELQWGKFVYFNDPDGNKWSLQELPKRPPGFKPEN
jgi:catechol 2,3-dioxygenase-like lactoylglutathione lyase family enzyme